MGFFLQVEVTAGQGVSTGQADFKELKKWIKELNIWNKRLKIIKL